MSNRFLRVRAGRYDFRRRVPDELVSRLGKREIVRSLGALPHAEAVKKARRLTVACDRLFRMIAKKPELTRDQIAELADGWFTQRVETQERWRETHRPEDPEQEFQADKLAQDRADGAMELIRMNDIEAAAETTEALLQAHGIAVDRTSPAFAELARAILRANAEAARIHAGRLRGDYTVRPADPLLAQALSTERKPQKATKAVPTLSEGWARFAAEKVKSGAWRQSMAHDAEQALALFMESAGDKRLDRYERQDASAFVGALQHLPAHRNKRPALKGKSLAELVRMAKADATLETISPVTIKKYATLVASFFGWCEAQGFIADNVASGVYKTPRRTVRRNAERAAWSLDQLRKLFNSPIYAGCKSVARRADPGTLIVRDADWWLPILGLFHPARLEELCQLRLEDVKTEDGVTYLDIHADDGNDGEGPGRRVKSLAAIRRMPLHRVVIELGFLDHITERRRKNKTMVFDLQPGGIAQRSGGIAQRYGFAYSKRFGRYRKEFGLDTVDFHAFRHNAITALVRAKVHPDVVNQLDGHEIAGERGRYNKGADLQDLKAAIDAIQYDGIDARLIGKR